jgi:uridine nucleosidase
MLVARIPLWIDCDPGHDDALALALACGVEQFHLLGVSTVHGNSSLGNTTSNAISILTAFRRSDVSVYPGAEKPLVRKLHVADAIHGKSGLDGTAFLPMPAFEAQPDHTAVAAMAEAIQAFAGTIAIAATGPLTNIALLIMNYPELLPKIRLLSIMGGGLGTGNWTEFAEFNLWTDAHAANIVLTNPALQVKTLVCPLNLTHRAIATEQILEQLQKGHDPTNRSTVRQMLYELMVFFAHTYKKKFGFNDGPPVHDAVALAAILPFCNDGSSPETANLDIKYARYRLQVVEEGPREGMVQFEASPDGVVVVQDMNFRAFWILLLEAVDAIER